MQKRKPFIETLYEMSTPTLIALCISISALTMTGCATPTAPSEGRAPLPESLTRPCEKLEPLDNGTGGAVLKKLIEVSERYYECARRHKALVDAVQ